MDQRPDPGAAVEQKVVPASSARIRDISPVVGLTERTVQAIVADTDAAGALAGLSAG